MTSVFQKKWAAPIFLKKMKEKSCLCNNFLFGSICACYGAGMTISTHPFAAYPLDSRPKPKLAQQIAEEIEREILARGLGAGENLGTEADLIARHGVSRSILREALLLVQRSGLAEVKRGKVGGLVVNAPGTQRIALLLQNYIGFVAHDFQDVMALRRGLEDHMLREAHLHIGEADMDHMGRLSHSYTAAITQQQRVPLCFRMIDAMCRASANPLLQVLIAALAGATHEHLIRRNPSDRIITNSTRKIYDLRHEQMRALMAADVGHALALNEQIHHEYDLMITLVHDMSTMASAEHLTDSMLAHYRGREADDVLALDHKLAEKVARRIKNHIVLAHLPPESPLGNEVALMHQYKVSRGVIREAVRILERHEMVRMTRGQNGGLKVTRPDPFNLVRTASSYIQALNLHVDQVRDVAATLGLIAVARAAQNIRNCDSGLLSQMLQQLRAAQAQHVAELDYVQLDIVAQLCGSHIAGLLMSLVSHLYGVGEATDAQLQNAHQELNRCGQRMIEHLLKADATMARRMMMQRHALALPMRVRSLPELAEPRLLKIVKP